MELHHPGRASTESRKVLQALRASGFCCRSAASVTGWLARPHRISAADILRALSVFRRAKFGSRLTELDRLHERYGFDTVIEGDARGVDRIAGEWARSRAVALIEFPANWKDEGRHAALIRNERMLQEGKPDLVIGFPGGSGTSHTCWKAEQAGIAVLRVEYRGKT